MDGKVTNTLDVARQLHVELVSETLEGNFFIAYKLEGKASLPYSCYTESISDQKNLA